MTYIEVVFFLTSNQDYHQDLLINALAEAGFDTFEETESGFNAYIRSDDFDEGTLKEIVDSFSAEISVSYLAKEIRQENWNQVWESNFSPIAIAGNCYVRATFHDPKPEYPYEIVIDPKMAFGTGHHQTTAAVMELMLSEDFEGKTVLDMGCGTGILAILANKLGASDIVAIDNDEVCYNSTIENSGLNNANAVKAVCGSEERIPEKEFDIILANINRNILLDQIQAYAGVLADTGTLIISGFFTEDLPLLSSEAEKYNLIFTESKIIDNWVAAKFEKRK